MTCSQLQLPINRDQTADRVTLGSTRTWKSSSLLRYLVLYSQHTGDTGGGGGGVPNTQSIITYRSSSPGQLLHRKHSPTGNHAFILNNHPSFLPTSNNGCHCPPTHSGHHSLCHSDLKSRSFSFLLELFAPPFPPSARNPINYVSLLGLATRKLTEKITHLVSVLKHVPTRMCPNPALTFSSLCVHLCQFVYHWPQFLSYLI